MNDRSSRSSNADASEAQRWMLRALELAELGQGAVEPNPMVGCVIVDSDGCVGEGYHQRFGGPHAEIEAIRSASDPTRLRGATAYVTLEPCCHHGKTPPCTEALLEAGISRVVIAMRDPFPQVDGGGLRRLRERGVEIHEGLLQPEAHDLNAPYLKRLQTGMPWVIAKWAMTIDGRIATRLGKSQWITGDVARREVHRLRGRVDAIAAGIGTVIADDPLLTARPPGPRVARRVVYCNRRLPPVDSQLIRTIDQAPVDLILSPHFESANLRLLESAGATVFQCQSPDAVGQVRDSLKHFAQHRLTNLMLEGGSGLLGSFFDAGAVDECHVYVGAMTFGGVGAPGPIGGDGAANVADAMRFQIRSMDRFDDDLRLVYRKPDPNYG